MSSIRSASLVWGLCVLALFAGRGMAEPTSQATAAYDAYIRAVEERLGQQHARRERFLASGADEAKLRRGELVVDELTPAGGAAVPGAQMHHWRGTAFAPEVTAAEFERLMKDFRRYPQAFSPEVLRAEVTGGSGDQVLASMRVRQKHVLTVVMDATYDVEFGRLDGGHGYSTSRSTRISEIGGVGTTREHALGPADEHGFLWRLNTYWTYEERDGGLYVQVETVSLSRAIPTGLGWAVRPFVESVPRESLEFTLRSALGALQKEGVVARR